MEKPYLFSSAIRHFLVGWLFMLGLFVGSFTVYGQAPAPTGLSVASLTQTTAVVSWECEPSSNRGEDDLLRYDYVVSTNQLSTTLTNAEFNSLVEGTNGVVAIGKVVEMAANQLLFDELLSGTNYNMLIRQNASDVNDNVSSWVPISFNTLCEGVALPVSLQSFDASTMPSCWVGAGSNVPVLQADYRYGDSGNALRLESSVEDYSYLFTPVIQGGSGDSELSFKIFAAESKPQRFSVGVADANDIMNYIPIVQDSVKPGEWQEIFIADVYASISGNYVWVIYAEAGIPSVFYVDDVEVHEKPACVRPYGLTVTNVTATGATFSWTPQGTEDAWNLELLLAGSETPIVVPVTENPFTYEGLNELGSYTARIQASCGTTVSEWSLGVEFTTLEIAANIPFVCDFEGTTGWSFLNGDATNAWCIGTAVNNGGTKALYVSADGGTTNTYNTEKTSYVWATKLLNITEKADYLVCFDWRAYGENSCDYMMAMLIPAEIQLEGGPIIPEDAITLGETLYFQASAEWKSYSAEVDLLPGQYKLAFFWINDAGDGFDPPAAVDNVSVTKVLCPTPELPKVVALGETNMTIAFANSENYNIRVFTSESSNPSSGNAMFSQDNISAECQITGLSANTTYYVYIQAVCAEGESVWVGPATFTTLCPLLTAEELPYENGFEETATSFPECWFLTYSNYENYPQLSSNSYNAYEGTKSLVSTYSYGEPFAAMVALPGIATDVDLAEYSLNFYMRGMDADIVVGVMTDPVDPETFTQLAVLKGTDEYKEYLVDLSANTGTVRYVALKYDSVTTRVYIDKVRIIPTPTCLKPTSFSIKDIVGVTALVEVNDVNRTTLVDVEYGIEGFTLGSGTTVQIPANENTVALTNLVPMTTYDVYVRNNCGEGDVSEWLPKQSFSTKCAAEDLSATGEFIEDFESYTDVDEKLQGCWEQEYESNPWVLSTGNSYVAPCTDSKAVILKYGSNAWMYRAVHLAPGNYLLSCDAVVDASSGGTVSLGFGESFSKINKIKTQEITNAPCQLVEAEFTVSTEGDYVIGIYGEVIYDIWYMLVDNIQFSIVKCPTPVAPVVSNISDVAAKISWATTGAQSYNLKLFAGQPSDIETETPVYSKEGILPVNGIPFDSITGLAANTEYYVYVQGQCADGSLSKWSNAAVFTTECSAISLSADMPYIDGFEEDTYLDCWSLYKMENGKAEISERIKYTGNASLCLYKTSTILPQFRFVDGDNFSAYQLSGVVYSSEDNMSFTAGIMKNTDRQGGYVSLGDVALGEKDRWREFTIVLTPLATMSDIADYKYVEFNFTGEGEIYLDDLRLEVIPTCPRPTNIVFEEIGETSALVDWEVNGEETQWRLVVTEHGNSEQLINEIVNVHPYQLMGLSGNTSYELAIMAVCTENVDESAEVKTTFKTTCGVMALPLEEDFNGLTSGIPECWENLEGTTISSDYKWNFYSGGYEGSCLRFDSYRNTNGNTNVLQTPILNLEADARLRFWYKNPTDLYDTGAELDVVLCEANGTTVLDTIANDLQSKEWADTTLNLSAYTGQNVVVKFVATCHSYMEYDRDYYYYGNYLYLDNVIVEVIPSCEKPQGLKVVATATEATIEITDEINSAWEYVYGVTGFDAAEGTPVAMSALTATISNLDPATAYDVYVRAVCAEDDKSLWYGPRTFTTEALPATVPYVCDFEGSDLWNLLNGTASNSWYVGTAVNNGGSKALYISCDGGLNNEYVKSPSSIATSNVWATRTFEITEEAQYLFSFDWKAQGELPWDYLAAVVIPADVQLIVGTNNGFKLETNPVIPDGWQSLTGTTELNMSKEWKQHNCELLLQPGIYQLAFYWCNDGSGGEDPAAAIDNISITKVTCPTPAASTMNNVLDKSATVVFAEEGTYNIKVFKSEVDDPTTASNAVFAEEGVTGKSCDVSGLMPSRQYYTYVQAVCADGSASRWTDAISFYTACETESLPFAENFDTWSDISQCWTNEHTAGSDETVWSVGADGAYSGQAVFLEVQSSGNTAILSTPALKVEAGKQYRVTFYFTHHNFAAYAMEHLNVYKGESPLATDADLLGTLYTYVQGNPGLGTTAGIYQHELRWTQADTENIHIIFEMVWEGGFSVAIDEVVVEEVPACERPQAVKVINATASSIDVLITDPTGSAWEAVTGEKGFDPNDESLVVTQLPTIVGTIPGTFTPETEMELYVRTDCGAEKGKSSWFGPVSFTYVDWSGIVTDGIKLNSQGNYPWALVEDEGIQKAQSTNMGVDNSSSDMTATVALQEGERATLSFDYYVSSETAYDYLLLFVDPSDKLNVDEADSEFGMVSGPTGVTGTYSVEIKGTGLHTIVWSYRKDGYDANGEDMAQIWNLTLTKNNFFEPENLQVTAIKENEATLSWVSSIDATEHQVCLMKVDEDTVYINNLSTATTTLTSLVPNTEYTVMVRSMKGTAVGDTTVWSAPLQFRTPMTPISYSSLPYSHDWEDADENGNWVLLGSSSVNNWIISGKDGNAVTGNSGNALYVSNNDSANQYSPESMANIYAYRSFELEAGAYSLTFDWKAAGEESHDYLRAFLVLAEMMLQGGIYDGTFSTVPQGWIAFTEPLLNMTSWASADETAIVEKSGYYNLVFLWVNDRNNGVQSPASVDNIVFDAITCASVSNLRVQSRGVDYIEVVWEAPLTDSFEAVCVPSGTDISTVSEEALLSLTSETARFDGLTINALYDIYVRSDCGEVHSLWTSLKNVKAYAEYATVPYICDFETAEADAWILENGNESNQWTIGSATQKDGMQSMYISNDGGISHAYDFDNASQVYAIRKFRISEAGLYAISFDWTCMGSSIFDYMRAYLVSGNEAIVAGSIPSTTNWIALGGINSDVQTWSNYYWETDLDAGDYQLVFYWRNDNNGGLNPPAAIDNVSFVKVSCMYPYNMHIDAMTDNAVRLSWSGDAESYEVMVDQSSDVTAVSDPLFSTTSVDTTLIVERLQPNTMYYAAVRAVCGDGEMSRWVVRSFTTQCQPMELPFSELFDSNPLDNCWSSYNGWFAETVSTGNLTNSTKWTFVDTPYGSMDEHMSINIQGALVKDWLVTPSILVEEVEGLALRFDMSLNPYTSTSSFEPGKQADDKFIVAISTDNGRTWNRSNGRIWDNVSSEYVYDNISSEGETVVMSMSNYAENGDTIRVAFYGESTVAGGNNSLRIDNVTIDQIDMINLSDSICAGSDYSDNGFTVLANDLTPGMHHYFSRLEMAVAEGSVDKMYNLDLYVYPDGNLVVYDTICAGMSYNDYGFNLENPTTRTYYGSTGLVTSYGCDSIVTLHLYVQETHFNKTIAICEGDSYEFGDQTLTESGVYTHTFAGMYCDSVVTLDLVVLPSETEESLTICHGDSVLFGDEWRKASGDYTATFENSLGCDSTVTLHLTVRDEIRYEYSGILCSGGVYSDENFANLTEAGDHVVTLTSVTGCDSIVTLHLTEKTIVPTYQDEKICDGESYTFGDASYNTTGEYPYTFTSVDGCDSLVTLRLTVLPVSESDMTLELTTSELPYELKHNGETIYVVEEGTEPGTYWPEITIENGAANGCDSIINLTLTVKLGDALHLTDYEELEFWPNPIERGGKVVISADFSPAERTNLKIEVYNSIGQCVATHRPTGESLYVEDFHVSGMYLVKVTTGTGRLYVGHVIVK